MVRTLLDYVIHVSICPVLRGVLETSPEWDEIADILSKAYFKYACETFKDYFNNLSSFMFQR